MELFIALVIILGVIGYNVPEVRFWRTFGFFPEKRLRTGSRRIVNQVLDECWDKARLSKTAYEFAERDYDQVALNHTLVGKARRQIWLTRHSMNVALDRSESLVRLAAKFGYADGDSLRTIDPEFRTFAGIRNALK